MSHLTGRHRTFPLPSTPLSTLELPLGPSGLPPPSPLRASGRGRAPSSIVPDLVFPSTKSCRLVIPRLLQDSSVPVHHCRRLLSSQTQSKRNETNPVFFRHVQMSSGPSPLTPSATPRRPVLPLESSFLSGTSSILQWSGQCWDPELDSPTPDTSGKGPGTEVGSEGVTRLGRTGNSVPLNRL